MIKTPCVILSMIGLVSAGPLWADGHGGMGVTGGITEAMMEAGIITMGTTTVDTAIPAWAFITV